MSFESDLCRFLNSPDTGDNRSFIRTWSGKEGGARGGSKGWNPLNVAGDPGFPTWTSSNGAEIAIYPDETTAAQRTAARITNGPYLDIKNAIWSGHPQTYQKDQAIQPCALQMNFRWWVTGATETVVYGGWNGGSDYSCSKKGGGAGSGGPPASTYVSPAAGGTDYSSVLGWNPLSIGLAAGGDLWTAVQNAITGPLDFLQHIFALLVWLLSPKHWLQMLEIVFGAIFVATGIWLLAKAGGADRGGSKAAPAAAAAAVTAPVAKPVVRTIRPSIADRTG